MRKFKYIGDVENYEMFGYKFPIGEPVLVDGDHALSKLPNNSHFEECFSSSAPKKKKPSKATADNLVVTHGNSGTD